jgi:hypothetical protein
VSPVSDPRFGQGIEADRVISRSDLEVVAHGHDLYGQCEQWPADNIGADTSHYIGIAKEDLALVRVE